MNLEENKRKLDAAVRKRNEIFSRVERLKGRLEESQTRLQSLEEDCRSRGVDPDKLEQTIAALSTKYEKAVEDITVKVTEAEETLQPYIDKLNL